MGLKPPPPDGSTEGMVWIPGGAFWMGSEEGHSDEKPVHRVAVEGFWMDKTEVTNEQFGRFVKETGYTTTAERNPDPNEPGAKKRVQRGGSYLCNDSYCSGYRPNARMKSTPDTGLHHTGFRCVKYAEASAVAGSH